MKNIRRKIIYEIADSQLKQRAVAFAILLKEKTGNSSVVRQYTPYKVHIMTGVHTNTVKKYVAVLIKMELAYINEKGDLYIRSLSSEKKHRNFDISQFVLDSTKNIYNQLRELLFLIAQAHKDYIKRLLRLRHNPTPKVDFKKVRRLCKKYCGNPNAEYEERGISYKKIATYLGCCARTAFSVVSRAVERGWCKKHFNTEYFYMPGVRFREIPGFMFTTMNYGVNPKANSYTLSPAWSSALVSDLTNRLKQDHRTSDMIVEVRHELLSECIRSIRSGCGVWSGSRA